MFESRPIGGGVKLRFSATLENIDRGAEELDRLLRDRGNDSLRFALNVGLREALLNSVIHGSHEDCRQTVSCRFTLADDCLVIEISDEGAGFDWRTLPTIPPDGCAERGRGLSIISAFFDEFRYNEKGNCVILTKRLI
jgi:anti-sigma regulatory factor (Ser/Thr protein kinase)